MLTRFTASLTDATFYLTDLSFPEALESALLQQGASFFCLGFRRCDSAERRTIKNPNAKKLMMELLSVNRNRKWPLLLSPGIVQTGCNPIDGCREGVIQLFRVVA